MSRNDESSECTLKKSVDKCERCTSSDQCKGDIYGRPGFCCPYLRLCLLTSRTRCSSSLGASCEPRCKDDMDQSSCACSHPDFPDNWAKPSCEGKLIMNEVLIHLPMNLYHHLRKIEALRKGWGPKNANLLLTLAYQTIDLLLIIIICL